MLFRSQCVPGQWDFQIVTDPPEGYQIDPRCWPNPIEVGKPCSGPGVACEYFGTTIGCDCNGIGVCVPDRWNLGATCAEEKPDLATPAFTPGSCSDGGI